MRGERHARRALAARGAHPRPSPPQHASLAAEPAAHPASGAGTNAESYARLAADPATAHVSWPRLLNAPLSEVDPTLVDIIEKEKNRQWKGLELIPSENFVSASVMEVRGEPVDGPGTRSPRPRPPCLRPRPTSNPARPSAPS